MITARLQIENGELLDTYEGWGFIYMKADRRFAAPEKKRDTSSYAEEPGAHEDPRTVDDEFDYKINFLIETPNKKLVNANSKIKAWNDAVREKIAGSDVKRCKTVTMYDDYKRCKIVGIPEIIETVDEDDYFRRQDGSAMDCVVVELVIHVSDPSLCEFDCAVPTLVSPSEILPGDVITGVEYGSYSSYNSEIDSYALIGYRLTLGNGNELRGKSDGGYIYNASAKSEIKIFTESMNLTSAYKNNPDGLKATLRLLHGRVEDVEGSKPLAFDPVLRFTIES